MADYLLEDPILALSLLVLFAFVVSKWRGRKSVRAGGQQGATATKEVAKEKDTVVFGKTVGYPIIAAALLALVIFGLYMSPVWEAGWAEWIHLDVSFPLPAIGAMVALGSLYLIAAIVDFLPVAAVVGLLTVAAFIVGFTGKAGEYANTVWQNAGMKGLAPVIDVPLWLALSLIAFPIIWGCITMKEWKKRSGNGVAFSLSVLAIAFVVPALWRAIFT